MTLPPLRQLQETYHYNPVTGAITYVGFKGPKQPGDPAGTIKRGKLHVYVDGAYYNGAAIAWLLFYGVDPSPSYVVPRNGDAADISIANLMLSGKPFRRDNIRGRSADRPNWHRHVKYSIARQTWRVKHKGRIVGEFDTRREALAAKRAIMRDEQSNNEQNGKQDD